MSMGIECNHVNTFPQMNMNYQVHNKTSKQYETHATSMETDSNGEEVLLHVHIQTSAKCCEARPCLAMYKTRTGKSSRCSAHLKFGARCSFKCFGHEFLRIDITLSKFYSFSQGSGDNRVITLVFE